MGAGAEPRQQQVRRHIIANESVHKPPAGSAPHVVFCASLSRNRGDRQSKDGDVMYPVGYSDKPVPDTSVQEADRNLVEKVRI